MSSNVRRLDAAAIESILGRQAAQRLSNRNRGGRSASKGHRFEHLYVAYRAAACATGYLSGGIDPKIEWQGDGFIDDVVEREDTQSSFRGSQLKNTSGVSWTLGTPSLVDDCRWQHTISAAEGYSDIRLSIVCSDQHTVETLGASVPDDISAYTSAVWFPWADALLPLIAEHGWLRSTFANLSKHETPSAIQVVEVAGVMMGAWSVLGSRVTLSELLEKARDMSPTLVRPARSDADAEAMLLPEFREIADSWPDFDYRIIRGFLSWSAFEGSTRGVLSMDCFDGRFVAWQRQIIDRKPRTFDAVEEVF